MDAETALILVAKLGSVPLALTSLEYLVHRRPLQDDGLMSWAVGSVRNPWLCRGVVGRILDRILGYPEVLQLLVARLVLALTILLAPLSVTLSPWLIVPAAVCEGFFIVRTAYGLDGSDQMSWITFAGLALVSLAPTPLVRSAFLWFIAFQVCLSYSTAGVAKATARGWRDGTYMTAVAGLKMYGNPSLSRVFRHHRRLAWIGGWAVVLWESLFPLVLVTPGGGVPYLLATGILFHGMNAVVMGLNAFFWAFIATYPAVLYCVQHRGW